MKITRHTFSTLLLAAMLMLAAGMGACTKGSGPIVLGQGESGADEGTAVSFSAYTSQAATKGSICSKDSIFGVWRSGAFTQGPGLGVYAFHQKVKSNGYPTYFNRTISNIGPDFMINQRVVCNTTNGTSYTFSYSPVKYWPTDSCDLLSFFAYAPYVTAHAWEDLDFDTSYDGKTISRRYDVDDVVAYQQDYMWSDPILNMGRPTISTVVNFSFRHICSRIGVTCKADSCDASNYFKIDTVILRASFNITGDYVYTISGDYRHETSTKNSGWTNLGRPDGDIDYVICARSTGTGQTVTATETLVGTNTYLFPLPGATDVNVRIGLTHYNGGSTTHKSITKTVPLALLEGKAYNILITVNGGGGGGGGEEEPYIEIGTVNVGGWDSSSPSPTITVG